MKSAKIKLHHFIILKLDRMLNLLFQSMLINNMNA